ncbi:MAG: PQQ-binding-like beta-propeller repeat protein [Phycisphaera sp.]|nr:PQQ-binding-like beta-propeller repeat protein [Phycisphaera sp.]
MTDDTPEATPEPAHDVVRPRVRWWPAIVVLLLALAGLTAIWTLRGGERQPKVLMTLALSIATVMLLFAWAVLFSRLPGKRRLAILIVGLVIGVAVLGSIRFEQVSGDLVPVIVWRWTPKHDQTLEQRAGVASADATQAVPSLDGAADSPQFLGPNRDGIYAGPALARNWAARPPREVWRIEIGAGWSGFAVKDGRAYTQEQRGDLEMVTCYELATGRQLWAHGDATRFDTTIGGVGPRGTPTIGDGRVYAHGATGVLNCLDALTGELVWQHKLKDEYAAAQLEWGDAASPLIVDGRVVINAGASGGKMLMAFDAATGDVAWSAGDDGPTYSSPQLRELAGVRQIISFNDASVTGHDPATGKVLWSTPWQARTPKVAQPLVVGAAQDRLFYSSSYGAGATLYAFAKADDGTLSPTRVWKSLRMKAKFSNMIAHGDVVYGFDDGVMACIGIATGDRRWKGGRYGHSQMIAVGDVLVILSEDGDVLMVDMDPDKLVELTRFHAFDSKCWNTPALAGRYLLVRNDREAAMYELPVAESTTN